MWRSMVRVLAILLLSLAPADSIYTMWHGIDDMMVICPVIAPPNPLPPNMSASQWPSNRGYNITIPLDPASGLSVDAPTIFSFIRSGKNAAVTIKYEVVDADGVEVIPPQSVTLKASGPPADLATLCACTGDNGRIGLGGGLAEKWGANYGKSCSDWDNANCPTLWPGSKFLGAQCCEEWCYVSPDCPDAFLAEINYGAYFSYAGACQGTMATPCSHTTATKVDPCACQNVDNLTQWSAANITTFGAAYGSSCSEWDMNNCADHIYPPAVHDTWCCENWCWTSGTCQSAVPSKIWSGLYWTTAKCPDDTAKTSQCPFKAQPVQATSVGNPYCACIGWTPDALKSTYGRRRTRPASANYPDNYGSTCSPWDKAKCADYWPNTNLDLWCCQSWCYVDEDCPTANPSSIASGFFWSVNACEDDGPEMRDCSYSSACKDNATNAGLTNVTFPGLDQDAGYGVGCQPHDEANCFAWWSTKSDYWGTAPHTAGAHDWCCQSWSYVQEACTGSEEGMAGLAYSYKTCVDLPSTSSNMRVWNEASKVCEAPPATTTTTTHRVTSTTVARRLLGAAGDTAEHQDDDHWHWQDEDQDEDQEGLTAEARKLAASRRRAGSSGGSLRRRVPPAPAVARRRQPAPTRVSAEGRRRAATGATGTAATTSLRRRQAPANTPAADLRRRAPAPATDPNAGRRRAATSGTVPVTAGTDATRRRMNPYGQSSPPQQPPDTRRRAVDVGGKTWTTDRRRIAPQGGTGPRRRRTRRRQPYGYTTQSGLTNNYGGQMPYKTDYGYSGKAKKKYSTATVMMAAGAGVAGGVVLGVGGYYAYNRYKESVNAGQRGTGYQSVQWCTIPAGKTNAGGFIECPDCVRRYGSLCHNQDSCFNGGGCSYTLPSDTLRDDLMATGFIPSQYKSPITIRITDITGTEFESANICPVSNNVTGQTESQWVRASSFQTNLFITLTEMNVLGTEAPTCVLDTHSKCRGSTNMCFNGNEYMSGEVCIDGWCQCKTGYCYQNFRCRRKGTTSSAPFQACLSLAPVAVVLLFLRALRHLL